MGQVGIYSQDEIRRRTEEFEAANRRDHARYALGALALVAAIVVGTLLALADLI